MPGTGRMNLMTKDDREAMQLWSTDLLQFLILMLLCRVGWKCFESKMTWEIIMILEKTLCRQGEIILER